MIARPLTKTQPIPFSNSLSPSEGEQGGGVARPAVSLATTPNWMQTTRPAMVTQVAPLVGRPAPTGVRHELSRTGGSAHGHGTSAAGRRASEPSAKYLGLGNLSVRSSVTGRHYRFEGHGATLKIDSRDQLMLRRIPELLIG